MYCDNFALLLLLLIGHITIGVESYSCPSDYVKCRGKDQCLYKMYLCDGTRDCHDGGSDEDNCETFTCLGGRRKCADNRQCIIRSWFCNGRRDCNDGSDERNCGHQYAAARGDGGLQPPAMLIFLALGVCQLILSM